MIEFVSMGSIYFVIRKKKTPLTKREKVVSYTLRNEGVEYIHIVLSQKSVLCFHLPESSTFFK